MRTAIFQEEEYGLGIYPKRGLVLVRGENAKVWDSTGRCYLDCIAGHGSANIGHARPEVAAAVAEQARRLVACSNSFYNEVRGLFLERLAAVAPAGLTRIFLCNSGTEAVEAALKIARFATGRHEMVAAFRGFHGRTLGALSVTQQPAYREGFGPLLEGVTFVPFNQPERLRAAVTERTAAVILEAVQGEGGVHPATPEFLQSAAQACRANGAKLILDEVQTGFGRTGRWFALQHFGLQPDLVCTAKSVAGGLPSGAVFCRRDTVLPPGKHGTTFGGNPLSCAVGVAALEVMHKEDLPRQAEEKGRYLGDRLARLSSPRIREIRRSGLMIGIELGEKAKVYIHRLQEEGVLVLPAGPTVIRLLPPLTIGYAELDEIIGMLARVLEVPRA